MNKMSVERRAQVLSALAEGSSIASTCRMFGVKKVTVLRLLADAGTFAARLHDRYNFSKFGRMTAVPQLEK